MKLLRYDYCCSYILVINVLLLASFLDFTLYVCGTCAREIESWRRPGHKKTRGIAWPGAYELRFGAARKLLGQHINFKKYRLL